MSYSITATEDAEGRTILRYRGDAQALVDACADEARGWRERGVFAPRLANRRKIMSLDPVVAMEIARAHGIPYSNLDAIFKIAHGRDYSRFRCVDDTRLWKGR